MKISSKLTMINGKLQNFQGNSEHNYAEKYFNKELEQIFLQYIGVH